MAIFKIRVPDEFEDFLASRLGLERGLKTIVVQDVNSEKEAEIKFARLTGLTFASVKGLASQAGADDLLRAESLKTDRGNESTIRTLSSITSGGPLAGPLNVGSGDPNDSSVTEGPIQPGAGATLQPGFTAQGIPGGGVGEGETPFDVSNGISPAYTFGPTSPLPGQGQGNQFFPGDTPPSLLFPSPDGSASGSTGSPALPGGGSASGSTGSPALPGGGSGTLGEEAFASLQEILAMIGGASLGSELTNPQFLALLSNPAFMIQEVVGFNPDGTPIFNSVTHPLVSVAQQAWEVKLEELGRQGDNEAQIAIEQIRQGPFGAVVDADTAVRLQEETIRAGITDVNGALSLEGATVEQLLEGISRGVDELRGLPPEEREFRLQFQRLQQQPQLQQQFLDFIGNPSAVGSAVGFGFDPFGQQGQGQIPQPPPAQTPQPPPAQPGAPVDPGFNAPVPGQPPGIPPRPGTGPDADPRGPETPNNPFSGISHNSGQILGPVTQGPRDTEFDPFTEIFNRPEFQIQRQTLPFLNGGQEEDGGFSSLGNFRGAGANPNANELRDRSNEELQFLGGQAASRGETPSALNRRVQSNTQQGL